MKTKGLCDLSVGKRLRGGELVDWYLNSLKVETLRALKPESGEYYFDYEMSINLNEKGNSFIIYFHDDHFGKESYSDSIILTLEVPLVILRKYDNIKLQ